jgi:hypothetical protein
MSTPRRPKPVLGPSAYLEAGGPRRRGEAAADGTGAETTWLSRHADRRTAVRVRLRDGSDLLGILDWHDRSALRLNLVEGGHRVVPRQAIAWISEADA